MKHIFSFLLILLTFTSLLYSQKQFEIGFAFSDQTFDNDIMTLADESYLLVLNHTVKDSSWTELLKINDMGDTLKQSTIHFSGYTISSMGVPGSEGVVLSVALAKGCLSEATEFGFAFVKLDLNLNELQRKIAMDPTLELFPFGPMKFSEGHFYCFYYDGIHVFDENFDRVNSYKGFNHLLSTDFDIIKGKIICANYDSTGIELKNLDGSTYKFLSRKIVEEVEVYKNEIYVAADRSILRLDTTLQKMDSLHTHSLGGSIWHPYYLTIYKDQLVAVAHESFTRYTLPTLDVVFQSYGSFDYDWTFYLFGGHGRQHFVANNRSVAGFLKSDFIDCSLLNHAWYYTGFFENSFAGHNHERPNIFERRVSTDSLWLDTISRYPDYGPFEFNIDAGIHFINEGLKPVSEFEFYLNHNLDTACENPYYSVYNIKPAKLQPGEDTTIYIRNFRVYSYKPLDSLFLEVNAQAVTANKKLNYTARCGYDGVFLNAEDIITRERPVPPAPPAPPATFSIYPNPVQAKLKFDGVLNAGTELRVYDLSGKLIFEEKVETEEKNYKLDVSFLPKAPYFLEIQNSGFDEVTKFIKM